MGYRGQVLDNPVTGERFVFHATSDETAGELLEFDLVVEPHGRVPGGHVHPGQREMDLALFMREYRDEVAAPVMPGLVQAVMAPLAGLASRRGLGERYEWRHQMPALA